jgi:hypothetical protein
VRPHPLFHSHYYATQASEHRAASLLTHYLYISPELSPHPLFDTAHYLSQHPALVASGRNPLLDPRWTAQNRQFLDRAKPAISSGGRDY